MLILAFARADMSAAQIDLSEAIAAERVYQAQMNAKEALLEAARRGALEAYSEYDLSHSQEACVRYCPEMGVCAVPGNPPCDPVLCGAQCFRVSDAEAAAEYGAMAGMRGAAAAEFDPDVDIVAWCGPEPLDFQAGALAGRMMEGGAAMACDGCGDVSAAACGSSLTASVEPDRGGDTDRLASLQLAPRAGTGVIGISAYSGRLGIAAVSYLPAELEVVHG